MKETVYLKVPKLVECPSKLALVFVEKCEILVFFAG